MPGLVLVWINDLFFSSNVDSHAQTLHLEVRRADPELAPQAVIAFVSLNGFGEAWQDIVRQLTESEAQLPILAFGPHADPNPLKKLAWWAVTRSSPTALSLPNYPSASEVSPSMRAW